MRHGDPIVRGYAVTHPVGDVRFPTQPGWDQIIYAKSGLFVARTDRGSWTVPTHRAICVRDGTRVRLMTRKRTAFRCLSLRCELGAVHAPFRVVDVGSLTRELLIHAVDRCPLNVDLPVDAALVTLLLDRLASLPTTSSRSRAISGPGDSPSGCSSNRSWISARRWPTSVPADAPSNGFSDPKPR